MTRHASSALIRIEELRSMQRAVAQAAAVEAAAHETHTLAALDRATRQRDDTLEQWHRQLSGSAFSPEISTGFAAAFQRSDERAVLAGDIAAAATAQRQACDQAWRQSDARCRQAGSLLAESRRYEARARDGKAMEAAADRITLSWRRR
jgi:hypothetical protein